MRGGDSRIHMSTHLNELHIKDVQCNLFHHMLGRFKWEVGGCSRNKKPPCAEESEISSMCGALSRVLKSTYLNIASSVARCNIASSSIGLFTPIIYFFVIIYAPPT
ncbi:hypothetical protein ACTXT7_009021 [Hymenolepis weldensis]